MQQSILLKEGESNYPPRETAAKSSSGCGITGLGLPRMHSQRYSTYLTRSGKRWIAHEEDWASGWPSSSDLSKCITDMSRPKVKAQGKVARSLSVFPSRRCKKPEGSG